MTLPDERYRAVLQTRKFLFEILNTARVPKAIKENATYCLRHYPTEYDMSKAAKDSPDIFAEHMEDVTRLFKQHEMNKNDKT